MVNIGSGSQVDYGMRALALTLLGRSADRTPTKSMGSEILVPESQDEAPTSTPEVEFALVLSRMIDSVRNDPEHLRATIYELARHKIREQSVLQSLEDRRRLKQALEAAIQGVETFVKKNEMGLDALPAPGAAQRQPRMLDSSPHAESFQRDPPVIEMDGSNLATTRRAFRLGAPSRFAIVLAIALVLVFAITQRETLRNTANRVVAFLTSTTPKPTQVASTPIAAAASATPVPEIPPSRRRTVFMRSVKISSTNWKCCRDMRRTFELRCLLLSERQVGRYCRTDI